jgi:hypothetical protein
MSCGPFPALSLLSGGVGFGFEFIDQLIELVEINSGPEPERVRNEFRRSLPTRLCFLTEAGAESPVDHVLERQIELARASLQEASEVIVDSERGAHERHHCCDEI